MKHDPNGNPHVGKMKWILEECADIFNQLAYRAQNIKIGRIKASFPTDILTRIKKLPDLQPPLLGGRHGKKAKQNDKFATRAWIAKENLFFICSNWKNHDPCNPKEWDSLEKACFEEVERCNYRALEIHAARAEKQRDKEKKKRKNAEADLKCLKGLGGKTPKQNAKIALQRRIASMSLEGKTDKEIASELEIPENTVKSTRQRKGIRKPSKKKHCSIAQATPETPFEILTRMEEGAEE